MADSLLDGTTSPLTREDVIAKWKDKPQEELLNAKAESDLYIKSLEARLDDISKDYISIKEQQKTGEQLQALLDRLDKANTDNTPITSEDQTVQPGMKPEEIQKLIDDRYAAHQQSQRQGQNLSEMQAKLRESLGDNYHEIYKQRLDTLGLTPEFADDLAKNHPSVFIKTFGLEQPVTQHPTLPRNTQRPTSFAPTAPKRDWNYYQEMKKNNPRMYLDPTIAVQMHNDAVALGAAFGMPED